MTFGEPTICPTCSGCRLDTDGDDVFTCRVCHGDGVVSVADTRRMIGKIIREAIKRSGGSPLSIAVTAGVSCEAIMGMTCGEATDRLTVARFALALGIAPYRLQTLMLSTYVDG